MPAMATRSMFQSELVASEPYTKTELAHSEKIVHHEERERTRKLDDTKMHDLQLGLFLVES